MQKLKQGITLLFFLISIYTFGQQKKGYAFDISPAKIASIDNSPEEGALTEKGMPITLKNPHGKDEVFLCYENTTMSEEMKQKHPEIKTYTAINKDNPGEMAMITINNGRLHAFVAGHEQYLTDYNDAEKTYESKIFIPEKDFKCPLHEEHYEFHNKNRVGSRQLAPSNGSSLRTFDFAIVSTTEFNAQYGTNANANIFSIVNDLNAVYRRTLAITFTVTVKAEFSDGNTYDVITSQGANPKIASIAIKNYFPTTSYDFGQVIHHINALPGTQSGSGIAYLGVVCLDLKIPCSFPVPEPNCAEFGPYKAGSWTQGSSIGIIFNIAIHEIGHLFDANHSFNGTEGSCSPDFNQLTPSASVEPGSGSTIMAYGGSCGTHNLTTQGGSLIGDELYFHQFSVEQMLTYINSTNCETSTASGNTPPVANANPCGAVYSLPKSTPFELIGQATDANGDNLTYQWDQVNIGPPHGAPNAACGSTTGPIFRSYLPTASSKRTFPALTYILNNANSPLSTVGECLPSVARTLNFKMLVYDNNATAGGIDNSAITVNVTNDGPLLVTSQNSSTSIAAGSSLTVTWDVNNTSTLCNNLSILLSIDGGQIFSYTLANNTPNDGSETITLPSQILGSTQCRVKVQSNCYTCFRFFDINNANFTITSPCAAPSTTISPTTSLTAVSGNSSLNLAQSNNLGTVLTSKSGTLATTDLVGNLIFNQNGTCSGPSNQTYYDAAFPFYVSTSGNYTISKGNTSGIMLNVYQLSNNGTNCNNWVNSNGVLVPDGYVNIANNVTVSLSSNIRYLLLVSGFSTSNPSFPANYTITFTAPSGGAVYNGVILPANYSYTYAARNTVTNTISAVSATSSFTSLSGGSYEIYGVSYYSGATGGGLTNVDPTNWVGQNFGTVKTTGGCLTFSDNFRSVTVTGGCSTLVTTQSQTGTGSFTEALSCATTSGNAVTFSTAVDTIFANTPVTLAGTFTMDGNNNLTIYQNFSSSFGMKISPGANVTLKNLKIRAVNQGVNNNVILNEGTLNLQAVEVRANVNNVIKNSTTAARLNASSGTNRILKQ